MAQFNIEEKSEIEELHIEVDVKVKCIENGMTQVKLVEEIDTTSNLPM